jgi:hypothetical protein
MVGNVDLAESWIQKSHCYLLVFKKTDKQSFDVLETYINQIYQVRNCRIGTIPIVLLANEDTTTETPIEVVSEQDVQTLVTKYKIDRYYNGYGTITGLFNDLCVLGLGVQCDLKPLFHKISQGKPLNQKSCIIRYVPFRSF